MNSYPVGSIAVCRFAAMLRDLTDQEQTNFEAGRGLPTGVGTTPALVLFDWEPPNEIIVTLSGLVQVIGGVGPIVNDGLGLYHVNLPVTAHGLWSYRGYGQDGSGGPVFSTPKQLFRGVPFS